MKEKEKKFQDWLCKWSVKKIICVSLFTVVYNFFGSGAAAIGNKGEDPNQHCLKLMLGDLVCILEEDAGTFFKKKNFDAELAPWNYLQRSFIYRMVSRLQFKRSSEKNGDFSG